MKVGNCYRTLKVYMVSKWDALYGLCITAAVHQFSPAPLGSTAKLKGKLGINLISIENLIHLCFNSPTQRSPTQKNSIQQNQNG